MPKYRGDEEDWLDSEGAKNAPRGRSSSKPTKNDKAKPLPLEESNATVVEVFPNQCRVRLDDGPEHRQEGGARKFNELLCSYRRATVFQQGDIRERSPVAIGDRVRAQSLNPQSGVVEGVCLRRNHLSRPAPGRDASQHVVAANVDQVVIVTSAGEPVFSPGLVDRFLVAAAFAGIEPLICLNKIDLLDEGAERPTGLYRGLGYKVFETSSKKSIGVEDLSHVIESKTVVFCGQSGVGKTSLLRVLLNLEVGKVGEMSLATGKGKHTTTAAILFTGPGNSNWADTPGVREFGLAEVPPERLKEFFPELKAASCSHADCMHEDEDSCAARELPRYASYRRILESLKSGER